MSMAIIMDRAKLSGPSDNVCEFCNIDDKGNHTIPESDTKRSGTARRNVRIKDM